MDIGENFESEEGWGRQKLDTKGNQHFAHDTNSPAARNYGSRGRARPLNKREHGYKSTLRNYARQYEASETKPHRTGDFR